MDFLVAAESVLTVVLVIVAIGMFCRIYPAREHIKRRILAFIIFYTLISLFATWLGRVAVPKLMNEHIFETQVLSFIGVIGLCFVGVILCFDVTPWTALFCCTAGYTTQNLASGTHGFIMDIFYWSGAEMTMTSSGVITINPFITFGSLLASSILIYALVYTFYVRKVRRYGIIQIEDKGILAITVAAVIFEILFDMVNKGITTYDIPNFFLVILKFTHGAACLLVLYIQYELLFNRQLQIDAAVSNQMLHEAHRQYSFTKNSIEAINARCHDIKHQIRALGENNNAVSQETLSQLAHEVDVYDSSIHTDNDVLDVILTEKSLRCQHENIALSCIADGSCLNFISQADLYALFGNALDNAIDAEIQVSDPTRRIISVSVRKHAQMITVHVENYFENTVEFGLDGVPISAGDSAELHGYGTRSMRLMVERYGGAISWSTQGNVFHMNAIIPID